MIRVVVLGASGSVGSQALEVIKAYPTIFKLVGISVNTNESFAKKIADSFKINNIALTGIATSSKWVITGENAINKLLKKSKPNIVLNAISGIAGLEASLEVINNKIDLALANKETLVMAGDLVMALAKNNKVNIYPVDSEHNAIYQILKGRQSHELANLILTASGGPFYGFSKAQLEKVTLKQALTHPNWKMGNKITIDSATMFNKGLEIIEAHHLFKVDYKNIKVMINRTSNVHSMVEFKDGSIQAHIGVASMKVPLINALSQTNLEFKEKLNLNSKINLELLPIKVDECPPIKLAYNVGKAGKYKPLTYCVANEVAVNAYLNKKIKFKDIYPLVEKVVSGYKTKQKYSLNNLKKVENEIVKFAENLIK